MNTVKRTVLFFLINALVIVAVTFFLQFFHLEPMLNQYGLNYNSLLIFCLVWGMGGAFISLLLSKRAAIWMMNVQPIDPNTTDTTLRNLYFTVEQLSKRAGLAKTPEVGVFTSNEINAFATGASSNSALIAVSDTLLKKLSMHEVEGVIGHEITHIVNGDMVTMTLIQGVINAFVMFLARILAFIVPTLLRTRSNSSHRISPFTYYLLVFVFQTLFMVLGFVVISWFSRRREFRADRGGADLAGKEKMINALIALQKNINRVDVAPGNDFVRALQISSKPSPLWRIFSTHPPLYKRIEQLRIS